MPARSSRDPVVESLIEQVRRMVIESGNPEGFDAAAWVMEWIQRPVPALGNKKPADFLATPEGQRLVSQLLAQAASSAFA